MKQLLYTILALGSWLLVLTGCEQQLTNDPSAHLTFSVDTLRFDTVFTNMVTPTLKFTVRNPQKNAMQIDRVRLKSGQYFHINVDGEANPVHMCDIVLAGGDSLFIFVKANIDLQRDDNPVFIEDAILFEVNKQVQNVILEAYGQDVTILRQRWFIQDTTYLRGGKPYLVYDYMAVDTGKTLVLEKGTTIYMHDNAHIYCFGNLIARGTVEQPIRVRGDRLDDMLIDVPYDYVAGRWGNIFLVQTDKSEANQYSLNYFEVNSGTIGIACLNEDANKKSLLQLHNSRIHNCSLYGLYVQNTDAEVVNSEISNCASYCVYLTGGEHRFTHNTVASYFTGSNIQSVSREDVAAVYINNLSKQQAKTNVYFYNNVIAGVRENNVVLATPLPDYYIGAFEHNYLRADSAALAPLWKDAVCTNHFYQTNDTIFRNTRFTLDRGYYDFQLDSVSPARNIADTKIAQSYPLDRLGNNRLADDAPDAGCYEWQPTILPSEE